MASTLRQGTVALCTGGVYCAHIYSDETKSLSWAAAAVQELWWQMVYSGPSRAERWSRAWPEDYTGQQAGIREEVQGTRLSVCHTFNGLTQKGVRDQLKRAKTQVK